MKQGKNTKKQALMNMIEALIAGDTELAAEHLHAYFPMKSRDLLLGETSGPEFADGADKGKISGNQYKNKPHTANLTGAKGPEFADENQDKGKISGNQFKKVPHKANLTGAKSAKKLPGTKDKIHGEFNTERDYDMGTNISEGAKPSAGMSHGAKAAVAKQARAGEDIGKPGKNFKKVAAKAAAKYGSEEAGEKVAAAAMWKQQAKK